MQNYPFSVARKMSDIIIFIISRVGLHRVRSLRTRINHLHYDTKEVSRVLAEHVIRKGVVCRDREGGGGVKMDSDSLKIKLSRLEIMYSEKALGALLGLIQDLTGTSTSPKKGDAFSPPRFLPPSPSVSFSLSSLYQPLVSFIKTREKRFAVTPA